MKEDMVMKRSIALAITRLEGRDHVWDEALVRLKESLPRTPPAVPVGSL